MKKDKRPLMVSIRCTTYNHKPYIRQCLDGFVMQKTNFRFEAIVHDDASTDGTAAIIKEYAEKYPDIIKPIFETENQWSKHDGSLQKILANACKGKYIAFCEGDDYWTDPLKLQKQIDYLEENPDYTLCFHKVECKAEKGRDWNDFFGHLKTREYSKNEFMKRWTVPTCSMVYRRWIEEKMPYNKKFTMGDNVIVATCLSYGKMFCFGDSMGVYRLSPSGWNGGQSAKKKCYLQISHLIGMQEEFPFCRCKIINDLISKYYASLLYLLDKEGSGVEFKKIYSEFLSFSKFAPLHYYFFKFKMFFISSLRK